MSTILFHANDMVKAGCNDCRGCFHCCQGMGDSIVLDPYDVWQLETNLHTAFAGLLREKVELRVDGVPVKVTPMEYRILLLLMKHPGRVFSADEIYERVWNEKAVNSDTIMVHVRNIREKIEINPRNPKYLKVVWGVGYKMEKQ